MGSLEDKAAEFLRMRGWEVRSPQHRSLLMEPDQVWVSPNPKIKSRKIVKIAAHEKYGPTTMCVYFVVAGNDNIHVLRRKRFQDWVTGCKATLAGDGE